MKRRPCWCPKPVLWELNYFLMQTLSFVPINLHRCWQREWKYSIPYDWSILAVYVNTSIGRATRTSKDKKQKQDKNNRFNKQNHNFARNHTYLYIFVLHDYGVKMHNFAFYGERKQATTKFNFFFLNLDMRPWNSTSGESPTIWQSTWLGIFKTLKSNVVVL